jgi:hypothetical protein
MSNAEKEYSFMHSIFMFKKVDQITKRLVPNINYIKSEKVKSVISLKPSISLKKEEVISKELPSKEIKSSKKISISLKK